MHLAKETADSGKILVMSVTAGQLRDQNHQGRWSADALLT
jgi:hypothetical protein